MKHAIGLAAVGVAALALVSVHDAHALDDEVIIVHGNCPPGWYKDAAAPAGCSELGEYQNTGTNPTPPPPPGGGNNPGGGGKPKPEPPKPLTPEEQECNECGDKFKTCMNSAAIWADNCNAFHKAIAFGHCDMNSQHAWEAIIRTGASIHDLMLGKAKFFWFGADDWAIGCKPRDIDLGDGVTEHVYDCNNNAGHSSCMRTYRESFPIHTTIELHKGTSALDFGAQLGGEWSSQFEYQWTNNTGYHEKCNAGASAAIDLCKSNFDSCTQELDSCEMPAYEP